ncbi:TraX family protein [Clostridium lundense]|uniref:TraX family protein n=1 Tax=Clostridium lundense TaxID=319475 RepID=UPI000685DBDD|nr:TraX family protein [Clostridium lundense]
MTLEISKKGITGFQVKLLALIFMVFDHIHYFFEFTGKVPVAFSWIGRLAGGLFLFMMIEGYTHTSNKKKYFLRIYLISIGMGVVRFLMETIPQFRRGDGFYAMNGILSTFVILMVMFMGIDYFREKKIFKGLLFFMAPFVIPYIIGPFLAYILTDSLRIYANILFYTVLPAPSIVEGGIYVIMSGLILYIFYKNRKVQLTAFGLFQFLWMTIIPILFIKPISLRLMFTDYYEWMGVFAVIFMFLYNGEKGKSMKKLFYIFYPAHIYILYGLSILLYNLRY